MTYRVRNGSIGAAGVWLLGAWIGADPTATLVAAFAVGLLAWALGWLADCRLRRRHVPCPRCGGTGEVVVRVVDGIQVAP